MFPCLRLWTYLLKRIIFIIIRKSDGCNYG
jgi:hypothetical protein